MVFHKDITLKVILLGDSGVGKTCLMHQFVEKKFSEEYKATIGADFLVTNLVVDNRPVTLQVWDTAGQEWFDSLGPIFYRNTDCCMLVFDVTDLKSFESLDKWKDEFFLRASARGHCPFVLVGNKVDLEARTVTSVAGQKWASARKFPYFETSAKDCVNVQRAFQCAAHCALQERLHQIDTTHYYDPPDRISLKTNVKSKEDCCLR